MASVKRLSTSKLGTYQTCPYQYKLTYVDYIVPKVRSNAAAAFGSGIHNLLEWWYIQRRFDLRGLLDNYRKYLDIEFAKPDTESPDPAYKNMLYGKAPTMLRVFHQRQRKDGLLIPAIDTEMQFEVAYPTPWGDIIILNGRIDLIIRGCDGIEINDYKTGVWPLSQKEADEDNQMTFYSLAYRIMRRANKVKYPDLESKLVLHYLAKDLKVETTRNRIHYLNLMEQINQMASAVKAGEFSATPSQDNCKWCPYKGKECKF